MATNINAQFEKTLESSFKIYKPIRQQVFKNKIESSPWKISYRKFPDEQTCFIQVY